MKTAITLFIALTVSFLPVYARQSEPIHYSWSNQSDWYYKKTSDYTGWKYIVIHHSATEAGSVNAFHKFHTQQGYGGVAYHFVIGNGNGMPDGEIQPTFRWEQQMAGTHVSVNSWDHNVFGIGICLVGNLEKSPPTPAQHRALQNLIQRLQKTYHIRNDNVVGHRHVLYDDASGRTEQTACPGKQLDMQKLKL
jgi:N-acetyl-anhydromuramyl-L-alanine amidase AmpD